MLTGSTGRTGKLLVITLAMLMALAGLSACAQQDSSTTAQNKASVKIGVSLSLTGDREADGVSLRQGYEMWRDDINKRGGLLGREVVGVAEVVRRSG